MANPRKATCSVCGAAKTRSPTGVSRCAPCARRKARRAYLLRRYGVTLEALERMLQAQGGRCAICRKPWTICKPAKRARDQGLFLHHLCVDHDHRSGAIRGLLCNACNTGIGVFDEDPSRFASAAAYLRRSEVLDPIGGREALLLG